MIKNLIRGRDFKVLRCKSLKNNSNRLYCVLSTLRLLIDSTWFLCFIHTCRRWYAGKQSPQHWISVSGVRSVRGWLLYHFGLTLIKQRSHLTWLRIQHGNPTCHVNWIEVNCRMICRPKKVSGSFSSYPPFCSMHIRLLWQLFRGSMDGNADAMH